METAVYLTGSVKEGVSMKRIRPRHVPLISWDEVETAVYLTGSVKEGMSMEGIRPRHVRLIPWAAECRSLVPREHTQRITGITVRIVVLH